MWIAQIAAKLGDECVVSRIKLGALSTRTCEIDVVDTFQLARALSPARAFPYLGTRSLRVAQSERMIDIAGVHKTFVADHGTVTALEPVTITIKEGEFISIVGPSGCGKSTLLRLISGLDQATGGTITLDTAGRKRSGGASLSPQGRWPHAL
ncbi:ATP-binding cassette domain-containing protein [Neorhizobium sp. SOG26]|uniref:ATP-binding cassette domain-containing protein n=1 Tax=Neorhizobium sp. SOG26 TaxID=2060726 RepID=UPI001FE21D0F|nr:ATP-binding cassette domain-containing protein [Neorhizobium sp. SOG26]